MLKQSPIVDHISSRLVGLQQELVVLGLSQLLAHIPSLFRRRDDVVFPETLFEGVSVLAVEQRDPARLLTKIFEYGVVFLCEYPDALHGVAPREGQLGQHVFLLCQRFRSRAVVDDIQRCLALEKLV